MIVNESLLEKPIFNMIVDRVKNSPWGFLEQTGYIGVNDIPSFAITISDEYGVYSPLYDLLSIPLIVACSKNNINLSKIVRIRAGLITSNVNQTTHTPHVDFPMPHKTMLFYLTNSDGPTILFDKKHSGNLKDVAWMEERYLNMEHSITPVENSSVIFDGLQFHSSTTPNKYPFRIVVNYNFID